MSAYIAEFVKAYMYKQNLKNEFWIYKRIYT